MQKRILMIATVFSIVLCLFTTCVMADTINVNKYGGADYTSIQAAINAATDGDIIKVASGVYYENILINKDIQLLGAGATGIIPGPVAKSIAYILGKDTTTANSFKALLESKGYTVTLLNISSVATANLSNYSLIIIGPDTGSLDSWGTSDAVSALQAYNGPVLGLGEGGYAFFGKLLLAIGYPHGWHGFIGLSAYVMDTTHAVWNTPNTITVPQNRIVSLYASSISSVALYLPTAQSGVVTIGRQIDDTNHYPLVQQGGRYFMWGFGGSPSAMNQTGKNVFINTISYLLKSSLYFTPLYTTIKAREFFPVDQYISPAIDFPIINYPPLWQATIIPREWWRLILLTGTTISGDGSSHVVTVSNVAEGRIDGFSIVNSGANYAGIYLSNSTIDISNNRITQNGDGIYAVSDSASIVRNNIIDNNGGSTNTAVDYAVCCLHSNLALFNNLIINNLEVGIYIGWEDSSGAVIINNTISNNADDGIWCYKSSPTIKNNIITGNRLGISAIYNAAPDISYNDVWGNNYNNYDQQTGGVAAPGTGDISQDPLFVDPNDKDYRLNEGSPCIDAGDPAPIYNDPDGTRNDMGAYGGFGASLGPEFGDESGFMFTTVGKIPVSEIVQNAADPSFGLADVTASEASALSIYPWSDAPFGGDLWLHGMFGEDDNVDYYQILVGKWEGGVAPNPNDFVPLNTPLTKVKYTIDPNTRLVKYDYVSLGPKTEGGQSSLYELNNGPYWSNLDLRMIWKTTERAPKGDEYVKLWENGRYTLRYKAYRWVTFSLPGFPSITLLLDVTSSLPPNSQDHITVEVNNSPVTAQIRWVKYDPSNPQYNPFVDGNVPECSIIHLRDPNENLRFVVTATHPEGYLEYFTLDCLWGKNRYGGVIHTESYPTAPAAAPPLWYGVANHEYQTMDISPSLPNRWTHWENCAYQFRIYAQSRATDGYTHLYGQEFNDHYFIDLGGTALQGLPGDTNNDGIISIDELTRVINLFLGRSE